MELSLQYSSRTPLNALVRELPREVADLLCHRMRRKATTQPMILVVNGTDRPYPNGVGS